jgi:hypothetical protein
VSVIGAADPANDVPKARETLAIAGFAFDGTKWDGLYLARRKGNDLIYAGKVDHGFDAASAKDLQARLMPLIRKTQPYAKKIAHRGIWVEPELFAEIEYRAKSAEGKVRHPSALVFVGDACEEQPAELYKAARRLRIPVFMFLEGDGQPTGYSASVGGVDAEKVFREIATITNGGYAKFDMGAAAKLAELLRAVAKYAAGGKEALTKEDRLLLGFDGGKKK